MKKGRNWLAALVCLLVLLVPMILAGYSQQVRPGDDVQAALYDVGYEGEVVLSPGRYDANWVIPGGRTLRALTVEDRATLIFNPMGPTTNVLSVDGDDVKIMDLNLVSGACGIWTGSFNTEVERCWFLDGDAGGWVTEPGTGKFIGCRFENTNTGLTNEHAEMLEVYDNYFVGNRRSIHCMSRSTSAIQHNNFADGEMFVTIQLDTVRLTTIGSCDFAGDSVGVKVIGQPTDHISVRNCVFHDMPYNAIDIRYVRVLTGAVNKVFIINNTLKNVGNNGVWADISGVSTNNAIDYRNNLVNGTRCCLASMRPLNISGYNGFFDWSGDMVWNATGDRPFMLNDPMLNGIYNLRSGSPAIDAGDPLHIYNDADGSIGDLGAHGGPGSDWAPQPVIVFPPIMGVEEDRWRESIPQSVVIDAYPNPFNAAVQMNWFAPDVVEIYDTRGQKIWVSDYGTSAVWSTSNQPSGVYICRLRFSAAPGQKLILQR